MSPTVVMKFGGTSLADAAMLRKAAKIVLAERERGNRVAVVVSAMGHHTDQLFDMMHKATARPSPREMDVVASTGELVSAALFSMVLSDLGQPALSMSAFQAGIRTSGPHGNAKIEEIDIKTIRKILGKDNVPVVTGYQGHNEKGEVTTLGRGGSDTTAAALGTALKASECKIYTDVDGVYSADPRVCPRASVIETVYFEEILELAALGASVLHPRAVEFAGRNKLNMRVLSTLKSDLPGTRIVFKMEEKMEKSSVTGIALNTEESKVTVRDLPDKPGIAATLFSRIAEKDIDVDVIVQNTAANGLADISFTVHRSQVEKAHAITKEIAKELGSVNVDDPANVAKVSLVGVGMRGNAGIAAQMFSILADAKVNIQMISTSEIKISAIIDEDVAELAVRKLHKKLGLDAQTEVGVVRPAMAKVKA